MIDNPKPFPFFKHVRLSGSEFVIFSDGTDIAALTFAAFEVERAAASHAAYPALDSDATGREYISGHKHVQTFEGGTAIGNRQTFSERGGGGLNDPAIEQYLNDIASYTTL